MATTLLKKGSHGAEVRHWQEFLGVHADGDFGPATEKATKAFQHKHGISADGMVGPHTLIKALADGYTPQLVIDKPVTVPASAAVFPGTHVEQINEARLAKVAPELQVKVRKFIALAEADGMVIQITQGLRTFAEQDALYQKGRTTPGPKVTNARGGQSNHNFGTAVDVAPVIGGKVTFDDRYYKFGKWAAEAGLAWGGDWKHFTDLPHLELPNIPKPSVLLSVYRNGGLAAVWAKYGRRVA